MSNFNWNLNADTGENNKLTINQNVCGVGVMNKKLKYIKYKLKLDYLTNLVTFLTEIFFFY